MPNKTLRYLVYLFTSIVGGLMILAFMVPITFDQLIKTWAIVFVFDIIVAIIVIALP